MKVLQSWYQSKYKNTSPKKKRHTKSSVSLVVIIPDFESFNCNVLQDFVMIVRQVTSNIISIKNVFK